MSTISANVLAPASYAFEQGKNKTFTGNEAISSDTHKGSMYLGHWRESISNKINPNYFNYLANHNNNSTKEFSYNQYQIKTNHLLTPVFLENPFKKLFKDSNIYFSFSSDIIKINHASFNQFFDDQRFNLSPQLRKTKSKNQLIHQEFYAPGYVFSRGKSSFGVAAVLLQQRFLDDTFGSLTFDSALANALFEDKAYLNTNRGTGYQLSFEQKLPANLNLSLGYQSKIRMNEFDTFGKSYSDPGDFDIPSQLTSTIGYAFSDKNLLEVSAEKITYSSVDAVIHSGYSQAFLNAANSPISPIFNLKDLMVYSINFEQEISSGLTWRIDLSSRQQPPATATIYNNILKEDTASVSYRFGITKTLPVGEINILASFANKPILVGRTDFGRLSDTVLNSHLEGVASWKFVF